MGGMGLPRPADERRKEPSTRSTITPLIWLHNDHCHHYHRLISTLHTLAWLPTPGRHSNGTWESLLFLLVSLRYYTVEIPGGRGVG
jgi:hypothetical protein